MGKLRRIVGAGVLAGALLAGSTAFAAAGMQVAKSLPVENWKLKQMITTFWCQPPAEDKPLADCAAQNFNLTWTPEKALDVAARHGLRAMLFEQEIIRPESLDDPAKRKQLESLIERVKDHPALEAYFVCDEPEPARMAAVGKLVAFLNERDPKHLAYVNAWGIYGCERGNVEQTTQLYRQYIDKFVTTIKPRVLSFDNYVLRNKFDLKFYYLNLALIREAALKANIPFMNIFQACTWAPKWRFPNAEELRWQAYTSLAYGAKGISYFVYWGSAKLGGLYRDGKPTNVLPAVSKINGEVVKLGAELLSRRSVAVYHTPSPSWWLPIGTKGVPADSPVQLWSLDHFVVGLFAKDVAGSSVDSFMIVNGNYRDRKVARVRVPGARIVAEFDRAKGAWGVPAVRVVGGEYEVELAAGDGRLFRIGR